MYGVETKRLNEQVKRNRGRFPKDFMFQLSKQEFENLIRNLRPQVGEVGGGDHMPLQIMAC